MRAEPMVENQMSLDFARLDMSKPCDSQRNCPERKWPAQAALLERTGALWPQRRISGACRVTRCGGLFRFNVTKLKLRWHLE
jgi:hypothetical protein